jgi:hypothetical protein
MKLRTAITANLGLLALTSCVLPPPPMEANSLEVRPEFADVNPTNIWVLPLEDYTQGKVGPFLPAIREEITRQLVNPKKYSPLHTITTDAVLGVPDTAGRSILEASFLSTLVNRAQEHAILAIRVSRWDATTLLVDYKVRFECAVTLMASKDHRIIWSGGLSGSVTAGGTGPAPRDPLAAEKSAAMEFARKLISFLPERRV